jgi:hypothetical protein
VPGRLDWSQQSAHIGRLLICPSLENEPRIRIRIRIHVTYTELGADSDFLWGLPVALVHSFPVDIIENRSVRPMALRHWTHHRIAVSQA